MLLLKKTLQEKKTKCKFVWVITDFRLNVGNILIQ